MMSALAHECKASSMAHVVARGQFPGSGKFRTVEAHVACLLQAFRHPPLMCVAWVGRRASGSVS